MGTELIWCFWVCIYEADFISPNWCRHVPELCGWCLYTLHRKFWHLRFFFSFKDNPYPSKNPPFHASGPPKMLFYGTCAEEMAFSLQGRHMAPKPDLTRAKS